jgi:hypothetical protein
MGGGFGVTTRFNFDLVAFGDFPEQVLCSFRGTFRGSFRHDSMLGPLAVTLTP